MDPVSITASVIAIADVAHKIARYISEVKNASADLVDLMTDLQILRNNLEGFASISKRPAINSEHESISMLPGLQRLTDPGNISSPLLCCYQELKTLEELVAKRQCGPLGSKRDSLVKAALFPLKQKEIIKTRERINSLIKSLTSALQHDEADLAMDTNTLVRNVDRQAQSIRQDLKDDQVLQWLNAPDAALDHHQASEKRGAETTGKWFIESDEYAEWKTRPHSIYWLHGILGCGKTILASAVIDELSESCKTSPRTLAYFYCSDRQDCGKLLRSLLRQLSNQNRDCWKMLEESYVTHGKGQKQPSRDTLSTLLRSMLGTCSTASIVLDALDECKPRGELLRLIEDIDSWHDATYHIFITSRRETDIRTTVESLKNTKYITDIQKSLNSEDIRTHIRYRLSHDKGLNRWQNHPEALRVIEAQLMEKADGMFLLADRQLDALRDCYTLDMLTNTLDSLPATMNDQYARILGDICPSDRKLAIKVFQWVMHSETLITLDEMVDILATDATTNPPFHVNRRLIKREDILQICAHLVDAPASRPPHQRLAKPTLQWAHLSVKEYLTSDRILETEVADFAPRPLDAHANTAQDCLAYFMNVNETSGHMAKLISRENYDIVEKFLRSKDEDRWEIGARWQARMLNYEEEVLADLPLLFYAAEHWAYHARMAGLGHELLDLSVIRAFEPVAFRTWRDYADFACHWYGKRSPRRVLAPDPLIYAIERQLPLVVRHLLDREAGVSPDVSVRYAKLSAAAKVGNLEIFKLLYEREAGASSEAALDAAYRGNTGVVEFLLDERTDVDVTSLLETAMLRDRVCTAHLLIARGARVDATVHGRTVLGFASQNGHTKMVQLLLSRGVSTDLAGNKDALRLAAHFGRGDVVKELLDAGFDVNTRMPIAENETSKNLQTECHTPLLCAADGEHQLVVQLLIQRGADVNVQTDVHKRWRTVLQKACWHGWLDIIRLLLKSGADVNVRGGIYDSALQAAC
ncbi:MAG: hypothetical protein Q9169_006643, partial [Polycauliona sp. 2 TL-2023]